MDGIRHRSVSTNGITMHLAESGPDDGRTVVLCHGFPECWYSWRHQLVALGEAGFHAVAPDQRGYGQTDMPAEVGEYTQLHLVGDIVGCSTCSAPSTVVGRLGAPVARHGAPV
jgi:pimeloyl-ACP methyl ester carboxylesterase